MTADFDVEVVVVGAGAAGLAAAKTLQLNHMSFKLIEARGRIGGRAWTDDTVFPGIAYDKGCHWLHCASLNPFVAIADQLGFRYKRGSSYHTTQLQLGGGKMASSLDVLASQDAIETVIAAITRAGQNGEDVSFTKYLDPQKPWYDLVRSTLTQMTSGDPENCSTLDFSRYVETGEDYPVQDGFGALLHAHASGIPVALNTVAYRVNWTETVISVETSRGSIRAKRVLICIPPSIINAGGLQFFPELPPATANALSNCKLGTFEKFAFLLDKPIDGFGHVYTDVVHPQISGRGTFNLHMHEFGAPLLIGLVAGSVGRDLERAGEGAMYEAGVESLTHAFGSAIRKRIQRADFTHWMSDPWSRGAYSYCTPGHGNARQILKTGVDDRLLFAGEHCSDQFFGTLHGAYLSGTETALKISGRTSAL